MNKLFLILVLFLFCPVIVFAQTDSFVEETLGNKIIAKPSTNLVYDYSDTDCVRIPLKITKKITTGLRNKSFEGQKLEFVVAEDVYYKNKILIAKDTLAKARLQSMITRGFAGLPAEIYITDFEIGNLNKNNFIEPVTRRGFSTTEWIFPIKFALTPFPPFGSLTNIFVGGNATLTPRKTIYVNYYPNY